MIKEQVQKHDDAHLLIQGELLYDTVDVILRTVSAFISASRATVINIDLQAMSTVNSISVAFLIECCHEARKHAKTLTYTAVSPALIKAIQANGVDSLIVVKGSTHEA